MTMDEYFEVLGQHIRLLVVGYKLPKTSVQSFVGVSGGNSIEVSCLHSIMNE